jgi:hypothetical protein
MGCTTLNWGYDLQNSSSALAGRGSLRPSYWSAYLILHELKMLRISCLLLLECLCGLCKCIEEVPPLQVFFLWSVHLENKVLQSNSLECGDIIMC